MPEIFNACTHLKADAFFLSSCYIQKFRNDKKSGEEIKVSIGETVTSDLPNMPKGLIHTAPPVHLTIAK